MQMFCLTSNTLHCKEDTMVSFPLRLFHLINYPLIETENYQWHPLDYILFVWQRYNIKTESLKSSIYAL